MERETGRVEAFSDGVFAIAITLLILEIRVPELAEGAGNRSLWAALAHLWPSFLAFAFSFFVILVMWINHHEFMRWVRAVDYPFLFSNGLVLLMVTFVPFPTAVVARHLGTEAGNTAVAFYCGTFLAVSFAFLALFLSVTIRRRLVREEVADEAIDRVRSAYRAGPVVYALATVLSLWSATLGLLLCGSLWILWTRLCYHAQDGAPTVRAARAG
ncbi:MAG: DUF1211 domain-containing protein [Acidobacteria bacterium]|nr:DUF1211 domain-containing protein [Acidobacteriota bacterium]